MSQDYPISGGPGRATPVVPMGVDSSGVATPGTAGNVASGATDSGNPVKFGAVFNTTLPTVTTGQRVDAQATSRGTLRTTLYGGASYLEVDAAQPNSDTQNANGVGLRVTAHQIQFDGTNYVRGRGDVNGTWMAGAGQYETVAASATDQILGATGAVGDYLARIIIVPATTTPGAVSIKDGNGSAISIFAGGTVDVKPIVVEIGMKTLNATTPGWKVTTGTSVSVIGIGRFT